MAIAIAALFLLCFLGFAIAGGQTWRWWHVSLLVLVMLAASAFIALTAMVVKTNSEWARVHNNLKSQLEAEEAALQQVKYASPATRGQSLPELRAELGRVLIDRGRVWRGVTPSAVDNQTITINMSGWGDNRCETLGVDAGADDEFAALEPLEGDPEGGGVEPVAVKPHGIEQGIVLIAYLEAPLSQLTEAQRNALFRGSDLPQQDTENVCKLPVFYLGDFKVTATTADSLSLQPVTRLVQEQVEAITGSIGQTWALYELMPIDRHDVFAGLPEDHVAAPAGQAATDTATTAETLEGFRESGADAFQGFTEVELRALLPQESMGLSDEDYAALISEYVRDQRPVGPNASDPPERLMKKVRFLQTYTVDVDVSQPDPGIERSYDPSGRAQLPHLRHGEPVVFQPGDVSGYMDAVAANELIRNGVAEEVEDSPAIYSRQLRDYLYLFRETEFQMNQLDQQIAIIQEDQQSVATASEKLRNQIASSTSERDQLAQDFSGFSRELAVLQEYRQALEEKRDAQRQELSRIYRTNRELLKQRQATESEAAATETASQPTPATR